jgi:hypothetical protein
MKNSFQQAMRLAGFAAVIATAAPCTNARPISYSDSTTAMVTWAPEWKFEAQVFYAPKYWVSFGLGHLDVENSDETLQRRFSYARVNLLGHRWNLPRAQANAFGWASVGGGSGTGLHGTQFAWNVGGQLDYETRRVYLAAKTELFAASDARHRFDTVQFGLAPYEHDISVLATWFVVQAQRASGGLTEGTDYGVLLRLFKGATWAEAGISEGGKFQAYFMYTF